MKLQLAAISLIIALAAPAAAQSGTFTQGPVIDGFGAVAKVDPDLALSANLDFKVVFDVKAGTPGQKNNGLDSVARFMNMLGASGVPASRIHPAVVIHNKALWDVTTDARYTQEAGGPNPNAELVRKLVAKGVPIYVCGQTLAQSNVAKSELIPGVKVALSAMHAHAILNRQGYSLNPF